MENIAVKVLLIKDIDVFSNLTDAQVEKVAKASTYKKLYKNDYLYTPGAKKTFVNILEKGTIKLGNDIDAEKSIIRHLIFGGEIFGENVFTPSTVRNEFAQAMENSHILQIPIPLFRSLVVENELFATAIMEVIIGKLNAVEERLHNFVFKKAKTRIWDFIKEMGNLKGIRIGLDECLVNHGMSHKEIAFVTDTSRQTVARVLGELKESNLIHFSPRKPHKILIRNFQMT